MKKTILSVLAAALLGSLLPGCDPGATPGLVRQTDGRHPQPQRFDVRGKTTLEVGDLDLIGTFDLRYFTLPGNELRLVGLSAAFEDNVLRRERLFQTDEEFPFRCNTGALRGSASGGLDSLGNVSFVANRIHIEVRTSEERGLEGRCAPEEARYLSTTNPALATGRHDPLANSFELSSALTITGPGISLPGSLAATATYTNRPPVARIASVAPDLYDFSEWGCPPVEAQPANEGGWVWPQAPLIGANRPEGLEVTFSSTSYDPDGLGAAVTYVELPVVDIVGEQWAHWADGDYRRLGTGRELAAMTFETGVLHRVLLTVIDRSGARSQAECRFIVN